MVLEEDGLGRVNRQPPKEVFLSGYTDRLSGRPGDTIGFHISTSRAVPDCTARLVRSISADPNPEGPGMIEEDASDFFSPRSFPSFHQPFAPGSYAKSEQSVILPSVSVDMIPRLLEISIWVFPTCVPYKNTQNIVSWGHISIDISTSGRLQAFYKNEAIASTNSDQPLKPCRWVQCTFRVSTSNKVSLSYEYMSSGIVIEAIGELSFDEVLENQGPVFFSKGGTFNGKLDMSESPLLAVNGVPVAGWDLSKEITSWSVPVSKHGLQGGRLILHNAPTRGVKSRLWDGSEFNWQHCPEHYSAVYFHDDDIYDFGWEKTFEWIIPDMPSGIYVVRVKAEGHEEALPVFICAPKGTTTSNLCVLVSTFTYVIYGNHARPDFDETWLDRISSWNGAYPNSPSQFPDYGRSTYNFHSDGYSGICHASHKRPLFNLRPGFLTFGKSTCSGLRHFPADSHLISWLHKKNISYDIITDDELDTEDISAISGYKAITTGTHPEYHTKEMLDALETYRNGGGNLLYLGGNGFYWRIVRHSEDPSLLEIRRSEDGVRAWASEPGEYYSAFDGSYGGLWRRNGRPPQQLVGVGFTAQGNFVSMPYRRICHRPDLDWVFEGIPEREWCALGDFGFSGHGAAGFELDRVDDRLCEQDVIVLAQSFDKAKQFILVPEEVLTHLTNLAGTTEDEARRADMVYFKTASGGQVFSVGSITFCGSLPFHDYENNISRILNNVLIKFLSS